MKNLLNKTFFKLLVRFILIILIGVTGVFVAGLIDRLGGHPITAEVQNQ